jgi:hypothetical protein
VRERKSKPSSARTDRSAAFFAANNPTSKRAVAWRTPSQRAWRVPDHLLDARADELFW